MADPINISQIIFQILKISPQLLSKYPNFQDQLLNLIFIPHIILIMIIIAFAGGITGRLISGHKGLKTLVGIAAYLYIVWNGWYGTWVVPLVNTYFQVALIFTLIFFALSIFWHPAAGEAGLKLLGAGAGQIGKQLGKGKDRERLEKDLRSVQKSIRELEGRAAGAPDPYTRSTIEHQIAQYKEQERAIKRAIEEFE